MGDVNVRVVRFQSEAGRPALTLAAAWATLNANRFDVVQFVGDSRFVQLFYIDTEETNADGSQGAS